MNKHIVEISHFRNIRVWLDSRRARNKICTQVEKVMAASNFVPIAQSDRFHQIKIMKAELLNM